MGRRAKGWFDGRTRRWYARLGPPDKDGHPLPVMLRDDRGDPIGEHDTRGKDRAIARLKMERANRLTVHSGPTVGQVCKAYLEWHREQGSAKRTVNGHWYHLTRFSKFEHEGIAYGERPAASVVPKDLWRLKKAGIGALRQMYSSVLACWAWAARPIMDRDPEILIPANPLAKLERPPKGKRQSKAIDWPEARAMLRLARAYARRKADTRRERVRATRWIKVATLTAMAYTGGRTLEIVTLQWDDIRWKEGVAFIPAERTKTRYTGKPRWIGLSGRLLKLLRAIQRWPHRHPTHVFCCRWHVMGDGDTRERELWRFVREDLKPWLMAEWEKRRSYLEPRGIVFTADWKPYWLRHSYSTTAIDAVGADASSDAMGHSREVAMNVYSHTSPRRAQMVAKAVEEARRRQAEGGGGVQ